LSITRIVQLDHASLEVADAIRAVMFKAYSVEAAILDAVDFMPLRRTTAEIVDAQACFLGVWVDRDLAAVAELEETSPGLCQISSLVVDPTHFREGLAAALVRQIIETHPSDDLEVSTGSGNLPALRLYAAHGFRESSRWTSLDGIGMVTLVRDAEQDDRRAQPRRYT
jgi:ribosomal protein S18 acetylase RimI-like enzyme